MSSLDFEPDSEYENRTEGNNDYLDELEELLADNLASRVENEENDEPE